MKFLLLRCAGVMLLLFASPIRAVAAPLLTGIKIFPDDPLRFDFMVEQGQSSIDSKSLRLQCRRMIKYFLASLTVPENEQWVNLSPYEQSAIVPKGLGQTDMGADLLAQDYLLKKAAASLMFPGQQLGKQFWSEVYKQAYIRYGTTDIPIHTFSKVWVIPGQARIYEHGTTAVILQNSLKVLTQEDYLALKKNRNSDQLGESSVVRQLIIPQLTQEVNQGREFSNLRQIYNAMLLATWYKIRLKESLLGMRYVDQNTVRGIDLSDVHRPEEIYHKYIILFKRGLFNYIKEDRELNSSKIIPRRYFAGGMKGYSATAVRQEILQQWPKGLEAPSTDRAMMVQWKAVEGADGGILKWERRDVAHFSMPVNDQISVDFEFPRRLLGEGMPKYIIDLILQVVGRHSDRGRKYGRFIVIPLRAQEQFKLEGRLMRSIIILGATHAGETTRKEMDWVRFLLAKPEMGHEFSIESNRGQRIELKPVPFFKSGAESLARINDRYVSMRQANFYDLPSHYALGVGEFKWHELTLRGRRLGFFVMASDMMNESLAMEERLRLFTQIRRSPTFSVVENQNFTMFCVAAGITLRHMHERGFIHTDPILRDFIFPIDDVSRVSDMLSFKNALHMTKNEFKVYVLNDFLAFYHSIIAMLAGKEFTDRTKDDYLGFLLGAYFNRVDIYNPQFQEIKRIADVWAEKAHNGIAIREILAIPRIDHWPKILKDVIRQAGQFYDHIHDRAEISNTHPPGGIDMDPSLLRLDIQGDKASLNGGQLPPIQQVIFSLTPHILKIGPAGKQAAEWFAH